MESTRQLKVSRLIQKDLSDIFQKESIGIPKGTIVSITRIRISPDLEIARVNISVFPTAKQAEVLNDLNLHKSHIRFILGQKVRHQLRLVPELHFYIDDTLEYIDKIDVLLKQ